MHKRAKKGMRFCAVVLLALLSLTGCGSKETADGKVKAVFSDMGYGSESRNAGSD